MATPQILDPNGFAMNDEGFVSEFHVQFDCGVMRANAHRSDSPYIESETMVVDSSKWKIRAYPNGVNGNREIVQFVLLWETDRDMKAGVKLHVLAKTSKAHHSLVNRQVTLEKGINGEIEGSALSKASLMSGGSKYIKCNQYQLTLSVGLKTATPPVDLLPTTFSERLFHKATSDVDIVVVGTRIPAHKLILSLASPVFTAMFENQMQESVSNEIVISDFSEEVVRSMLRCIYDWSCVESEVDKSPEQLMCIANKYELTAIENVASNHIVEAIRVDNAVDTLLAAHRFDRMHIKAAAMDFITVNTATFFLNPDFAFNLGVELIKELLNYMATNKRISIK